MWALSQACTEHSEIFSPVGEEAVCLKVRLDLVSPKDLEKGVVLPLSLFYALTVGLPAHTFAVLSQVGSLVHTRIVPVGAM